jgi:biopolymer transport protein ExbD
MAAVKTKRHGPTLDMTAMCDVAFLLLTFFIMTTTFKSQETVEIKTPSSISKDVVEEKGVCTISVDRDGKYFFGITNPKEKQTFIETINQDFQLGLTGADVKAFNKIAELGVSKTKVKSYLALTDSQKMEYKSEGIPCDSSNTELVDWVKIYRKNQPTGVIAIRGDVKTQYPAIKVLFDEFGKIDLNKFKLITKGE